MLVVLLFAWIRTYVGYTTDCSVLVRAVHFNLRSTSTSHTVIFVRPLNFFIEISICIHRFQFVFMNFSMDKKHDTRTR